MAYTQGEPEIPQRTAKATLRLLRDLALRMSLPDLSIRTLRGLRRWLPFRAPLRGRLRWLPLRGPLRRAAGALGLPLGVTLLGSPPRRLGLRLLAAAVIIEIHPPPGFNDNVGRSHSSDATT